MEERKNTSSAAATSGRPGTSLEAGAGLLDTHPVEANFCELRGLHLDKRGIRKLGEPTGDLRFAASSRAYNTGERNRSV